LGGLEVTRRRTEDPRSLKLIDSSISAAQRGAKLIAQLMAFARKQNLQIEYLPLNTLVHEMHELLQRSVGASVRLVYEFAPDVWPVMADASQVQTALLNLAINARDAMPGGGTLRIETRNQHLAVAEADLPAGDYAVLSAEDTGTGMSEEVQARLFEPFFTTKDVGKGTGLGLAQVYGFVRQSGGGVRVHSVLGQGTTFTILLPRAAPDQVMQHTG
jgi:signal transduction histidine kinase